MSTAAFFVEKLFTFAVKEADLEVVTMTDVQKKSLNIINQVPTTCGYTVIRTDCESSLGNI